MNSSKPRYGILYLSICRFSLLFLSSLWFGAFSLTALAQETESPPVARLITGPVDVSYSRTSRATAALSETSFPAPAAEDATTIERSAFDHTNEVRRQKGLAPLPWDPSLCLMARRHSENMARLGFFSHQTPEGSHLKERARAAGIAHFRLIAENIAYNQGFEDPGAFAVERWMISPGHRANILYDGFQASAVGSFVTAEGRVYLTQLFIMR
jgi:uncharacterized protein YkwD